MRIPCCDYIADFGTKSRSSRGAGEAEFGGRLGVEHAHLFPLQQAEQHLRLLLREQEFDFDGQIPGELEEMLLVQHEMPSVTSYGTERRAAMNARLPPRFEQLFIEEHAVMLAVLVHVKAQIHAVHGLPQD